MKEKFRNYLLKLLVRRDYSRAELLQKAQIYALKNPLPADEIDEILEDFVTRSYQSDERFAAAFVRYQSQRGQGAVKIRRLLQQKGVSDAIIKNALADIDWQEIAEKVYAAKYVEPPQTPNERAKRQRFLAWRGFTFDEIKKIV